MLPLHRKGHLEIVPPNINFKPLRHRSVGILENIPINFLLLNAYLPDRCPANILMGREPLSPAKMLISGKPLSPLSNFPSQDRPLRTEQLTYSHPPWRSRNCAPGDRKEMSIPFSPLYRIKKPCQIKVPYFSGNSIPRSTDPTPYHRDTWDGLSHNPQP